MNQGEFIEETILSVLSQKYPNVEHIIMDGGSTDGTLAVIDRYRDRLAQAVSEPDEGQSDAITKGLRQATGEILTWLNADDMLAPGALPAVAMAFHTSKADLVAGICQLLRNGTTRHGHLSSCPDGALPLEDLLDIENNWLKGRFFHQPEAMFSREIWERAGGYVDRDLHWNLDYDLWVRFARAGARIHVIGRPVAIFRVHEQQKTFASADYVPELHEVRDRHRAECGPSAQDASRRPEKNFRAVFLNDSGPRYGAGIAHTRLGRALQSAGHDVTFIAASDDGVPFDTGDIIHRVLDRRPDIVFVGNLHGAGHGPDLLQLLTRLWPCCQVLHDLWAVTGRCAYYGDCAKYLERCDETCATATEYPSLPAGQIEDAWCAKRDLLKGTDAPLLLANSEWTRRSAEESAVVGEGGIVRTIKLAHPLDVFRPRDRNLCREALTLPKDDFIVLFAACDVQETRKGLAHLLEALRAAQLPQVTPVCFGRIDESTDLYPDTIAMGYVEDPERIAMLYGAADVFVGPSLMEAFGQVFVEAAACGTPSVAYDTGGVPEALVDGITGRLVRVVEPSALAAAITELHGDPALRHALGAWGRIHVENEWSPASAYHRINCLLRTYADRFGFEPPRSIKFPRGTQPRDEAEPADDTVTMHAPPPAHSENTDCRVVLGDGFGPVEGPFPDIGPRHRFRWATGPVSTIGFEVANAGHFRVVIRCISRIPRQKIRVMHDGVVQEDIRPRVSDGYDDVLSLTIGADMTSGLHEWALHFRKTSQEEGGNRKLALIVYGVDVERTGACARQRGTM